MIREQNVAKPRVLVLKWSLCELAHNSLKLSQWTFLLSFFLFLPSFLSEPHLQRMEVPRLGVEWELQLPACTTATATPDP